MRKETRSDQLEAFKKNTEEDEARGKRLRPSDQERSYLFKKFLDEIEKRLEEKRDEFVYALSDPGAAHRHNLMLRSFVIKGAYKAFEDGIKHLKGKYYQELSISKENTFPREWMKNDKKINEVIQNSPAFILLANYLRNRNRYRDFDFEGMIEEADRLTGGRRYLTRPNWRGKEQGYIFSSFFTNKAFYDKATRKTGLSKNTIQRYLSAFAKIGIVEILYEGKTRGRLYADGYFIEHGNTRTKKSFLKKDPVIMEGLRNLPQYVRDYEKQE